MIWYSVSYRGESLKKDMSSQDLSRSAAGISPLTSIRPLRTIAPQGVSPSRNFQQPTEGSMPHLQSFNESNLPFGITVQARSEEGPVDMCQKKKLVNDAAQEIYRQYTPLVAKPCQKPSSLDKENPRSPVKKTKKSESPLKRISPSSNTENELRCKKIKSDLKKLIKAKDQGTKREVLGEVQNSPRKKEQHDRLMGALALVQLAHADKF